MGTSSEGDRPWQSYNTVYTNAKAGMDGVDKEKVQRIVYEMSKGSKYFENEQRKEAFIKQKIESLRAQVDKLTDKDISHFQVASAWKIYLFVFFHPPLVSLRHIYMSFVMKCMCHLCRINLLNCSLLFF